MLMERLNSMFSRSKSGIHPKDFKQVMRDKCSHSKFQILRMVAHVEVTSWGGRNKTEILPLLS